MKILYRPHCGGLAEAMAKVKEFNSLKELFDYLIEDSKEQVGKEAFGLDDICIKYYGYDSRIDWETYIVCIGRYLNEEYRFPQGIGFLTFK